MKQVSIYLFLLSILAVVFFCVGYIWCDSSLDNIEEQRMVQNNVTTEQPEKTTQEWQKTVTDNKSTQVMSSEQKADLYYPANNSQNVTATKTGQYFVCFDDGKIIVYEKDKKTIYEETSIDAAHLSEENLQSLQEGIWVQTVEELYGLLESFSS